MSMIFGKDIGIALGQAAEALERLREAAQHDDRIGRGEDIQARFFPLRLGSAGRGRAASSAQARCLRACRMPMATP